MTGSTTSPWPAPDPSVPLPFAEQTEPSEMTGMIAVNAASKYFGSVVAVSDVSGAYHNPDGIDVRHCLSYSLQHGGLEGYQQADAISNEELLALEVELLIPAAIGGVIHRDNVDTIQAPLIVEAANGPIDPDADDVLEQRDVTILPDILANAGGVTVSYFEWAQNLQQYKWGLNRVRQELDHVLSHAFENVWQRSNQEKVSLRTAAYMVAIERVHRAKDLAGLL